MRLTTPDHEFHKYSHGAKKSAWGTFIEARPVAKVTRSNGKVSIRPAGGRVSGITVPIRDNFWIVPKGVKFKMRIRVKGSGILSAGLLCYATDAKGTRLNRRVEYSVPRFKLNGKEQVFEKIVEQKVFGYACPYVVVGKNYWADISEFSLTPVK